MIRKYPLATSSWDESEYQAMRDVIASGSFTMGEKVAQYEKKFAQYIGAKYAVMVNSGSSANLLMIAAMFYTSDGNIRLKRGDEVIVPAVSWSTTYYPLYQYGLKIKFVDIDLFTLNYDLKKLAKAVTNETKLIVAVNLLGNPNDFLEIQRLIEDRCITLVEDNCESLGAEYLGKKAGTFGLMGSYSSFFSHHISTMEGGVISTDQEEFYHILLSLRAHGWTRNLPSENLVCGTKSNVDFDESFRFVLPGYNVRPLELSGAIGIKQLEKLPYLIDERRKNGKLLQQALIGHPYLMIQKEIGESSWFGFSLVINPEAKISRKTVLEKLEKNGFDVRPIVAGNFVKNEVIKYFDYEIHGTLEAASIVDKNGLFIGNHHYPMEEAVDELKRVFPA